MPLSLRCPHLTNKGGKQFADLISGVKLHLKVPESETDIPPAANFRGNLSLNKLQVGFMGYPDQLSDRFGGAQNKVDIAEKNIIIDDNYSDDASKKVDLENINIILYYIIRLDSKKGQKLCDKRSLLRRLKI